MNSKIRFSFFSAAIVLALFLFSPTGLLAQDNAKRPSPAEVATQTVDGAKVTVNYSSPSVKNRVIWGELVPYGEVWRTGANEATTISLEKAYKIGGKTIEPGKYALFTIPGKDEWTIILNKEWDQWGAYDYEESQDVVRFKVKPETANDSVESLKFEITPGGEVVMKWEKLRLRFQLEKA